ncbi:MAG: NAD-dependent deacylase [Bacteroidales bacterium]|nr:NAD-dependent deacylase [Bacteroidales bacterium]
MKQIVVLTGAGISAESGIKTFRDDDGLWQNHHFEKLATPEAWASNPQLVLDFYNARRKQLLECEPNEAHKALVKLESQYEVHIITQNVDDLHERAGSKNVLHLHGELRKVRSTKYPELVYELEGWELKLGDKCEKGTQLRPHIVWFGEMVATIEPAIQLVQKADHLIVIGTSLMVYPAAGLINFTQDNCPITLIDPKTNTDDQLRKIRLIKEKASTGVPKFVNELLN